MGQVRLHAEGLGALRVARDRQRHGKWPAQQMRDLEPEALARIFIERCADPDRRLPLLGLVEDALPGELGRQALDQNLTARVERLLGDVQVDRAALDVEIAHHVRGDHLVEARLAAELDVREFEVFAHRHVENEATRGGPPKRVGLHAHGLHVAERLMVEQLKRGRGGAARLECDLSLLRVGTQVGNEVAAFAEGNFLT